MFSRLRKKVKAAIKDENLQNALQRASSRHNEKFTSTTKEIPWEEYKERARSIRETCIKILPELIQKFTGEAERSGAFVYSASTPEEARSIIGKIAADRKARLIVKAKSMVSEEIHLNDFLEKKGFTVIETDLGEWVIQLAKERPSHITAPALHKTKKEVAEILSRHLGREVPPDAAEIVRIAREEMRRYFVEADIGISGANLAIAETGTLCIISNEGNARLATALPPVHIALITAEKFVETMEQATPLLKALTIASSGRKITSYVSFITGPSSTTDIEKEHVIGVHGPREVHIVILDNGRLKAAREEGFKEILYCLKCGGCMLLCPVFQAVGGHIYGGPVYPGGIGLLLTAVTRTPDDAFSLLNLCADCKKCEDFCPVGIPTGDLLLALKDQKGPAFWESLVSNITRKNNLTWAGAKILAVIQKLWKRNGHWKKLPFSWARDKFLPLLRPDKFTPSPEKKKKKVYLFQGCLVKLFFPEIRDGAAKSLSRLGFDVVCPSDQSCCGAPSLHLGRAEDVQVLAEANIASFERENPDFVLTVCPSGRSMLKNRYPQVHEKGPEWAKKVFDFTEFMVSSGYLPEVRRDFPISDVFYHSPCHSLNEFKARKEPLELLRALGFNPKEEEDSPTCCGFCGIFSFKNPELSAHLWKKKREKIAQSGATLVATDCPGCLLQFRSYLQKEDGPCQAFHSAELLAESLERTSVRKKEESEKAVQPS